MNQKLRNNTCAAIAQFETAIRALAQAYYEEGKECNAKGIPARYDSITEWVRAQMEGDAIDTNLLVRVRLIERGFE